MPVGEGFFVAFFEVRLQTLAAIRRAKRFFLRKFTSCDGHSRRTFTAWRCFLLAGGTGIEPANHPPHLPRHVCRGAKRVIISCRLKSLFFGVRYRFPGNVQNSLLQRVAQTVILDLESLQYGGPADERAKTAHFGVNNPDQVAHVQFAIYFRRCTKHFEWIEWFVYLSANV